MIVLNKVNSAGQIQVTKYFYKLNSVLVTNVSKFVRQFKLAKNVSQINSILLDLFV